MDEMLCSDVDSSAPSGSSEVVLRSILAVLRSPQLSDAAARQEAERIAAQGMVAQRADLAAPETLEPVAQAFKTLKQELETLSRFGPLQISFVPPPTSGRAVPQAVARSARACVRLTLLAQIDAQSASRARVQWNCDGTNLLVDIHDNGLGTTSREDDLYRPIAQIIERLQGGWSVESTQGWGGHLHMVFPLEAPVEVIARDSSALSRRQQQIFRLISAGATNAEIAGELSISVNTVKYHISTMMRSCGVSRRAQLVSELSRNVP